jgi:hypothetical protein
MEQFTDTSVWAVREFGGADLGDCRRTQRLVRIASGAASRIGAAMSSVCGKCGSQAATRLLGRAEVTLASVLEPHIKRTSERCAGERRILAVQDTTALDFTGHACTDGLGPITTASHSQGLLMHTVLAVGTGKVPVGLLGMQVWARSESMRGCSKDRRKRHVNEKESNKWLVGLEQAQSAVSADVRMLVVGDRESDVYALFAVPRRGGVELLVRLAQNRALDDEEHSRVREALGNAAVAGVHRIEVPRQKGRPKRVATLELRVARVSIKRPAGCGRDMPGSVEVSLIWAREKDAPDGLEPLDWVLLTTERVEGLGSAVEMVECYSVRWVIEEFHRVLKDGCRIEKMQFDTVERIKPALAILAVVAWRVLRLTKQSRSDPDASVSEVANAEEVSVLNLWIKSQGEREALETVRAFTIAVARLGGFLGRKSDGMPGTKTIWQGLRNLEMLLLGHRLATQQEM